MLQAGFSSRWRCVPSKHNLIVEMLNRQLQWKRRQKSLVVDIHPLRDGRSISVGTTPDFLPAPSALIYEAGLKLPFRLRTEKLRRIVLTTSG